MKFWPSYSYNVFTINRTIKTHLSICRDNSLQLADTASKEGKEVEKEAEKEACNALLSLTAALYASLGLSTNGKGCHI